MSVLWKVERFLARSGMRPAVFGRRALNDPQLVFDLRRGREPRAPTTQRIEAYIAAQREHGR